MNFNKNIALYGVQVILGLLLIFWGYNNLFPIEPFECKLVEQHLANWYTAPVLVRLIISLKFITGLFLILRINPRNILTKTFVCFIALGLFDLSWDALHSDRIIKLSYGCFYGDSPLFVTSIIYLLCIAGCVILLLYPPKVHYRFKWIKYIMGLVSFSLPFILNPVFPGDLMDKAELVNQRYDISQIDNTSLHQLSEDTVLIAFFSTNCPYCLDALKKIGVARKRYNSFKSFFICFLGSEEEVNYFFKEANTSFDYTILESEQFFELSGPIIPSFIIFADGRILKRWNGKTFNYYTMSSF